MVDGWRRRSDGWRGEKKLKNLIFIMVAFAKEKYPGWSCRSIMLTRARRFPRARADRDADNIVGKVAITV